MAPIDHITKALRDALGGAIADQASTLDNAAAEAGKGTDAALQSVFGGGFSLDDLLLLIPGVGELLTLPTAAWHALFSKAAQFTEAVAAGWALGEAITEISRPILRPVFHAAEGAVTSEIHDAVTAAQLVARGLFGTQHGTDEAAGSGLDSDHFNRLVSLNTQRPGLSEALELLRRDQQRADFVRGELIHQGYEPSTVDELLTLQRNLLSAADLALAQLRGIVQLDEAYAYADKLGVDKSDFDVLIGNTGEPPGPESLMEALRRKFIDQPTFEHGIRQSRIRDEWIPTMLDLRSSPMTVADAVRAVIENYITDEEGQAIAEQNGLMADHWPIVRESYGRPLAHDQMMTLYHRGQATLDDVRQAMRESDIKDKYIEKSIELGRRLVPERTIVSMVDHGVITHERALVMLAEQGYNTDDAEALIKLGAAQRLTSHKTLSKSDTLAMYQDGLIKRQDAVKHLTAIGYTDTDAKEMLDLADYKRKASALKLRERQIQAAHKAGHLSDGQAIHELINAGLDSAQAHDTVDLWNGEKNIITRTLTEAQTIKAIGDRIITLDDGRVRLKTLGYGDRDIDVLFKMAGVMDFTPLPPPAGATG